ncbi:MAG: hypothetical protein ACOXZ4_00460 [Sphaerochaetaceae bacterium]
MLRDASTQPLDLAVVDKMGLDALNTDTIDKYRRRLEGVKPDFSGILCPMNNFSIVSMP